MGFGISARGFTLVEMLIAIAVILVVAAIGMGVYVSTADDTRRALTEARIRQLDVACKTYKDATGAYPPDGGLADCLTKERTVPIGDGLRATRPALLPEDAVLDGWGRPIRYKSPGVKIVKHVDLWSAGSNGVDGDVDDVHNWKG